MRELTRQGRADPFVRDLANLLVSDAPEKNWCIEIARLFCWVRDGIRYSLDTNNVEVLQSAKVTATLGYGDCDDKCILLASLCESIGHPCIFVALGFAALGEFTHVIVVASGANETPPISLDPTERVPPGWHPPDATCAMLCPID